MAQAFRSVRSTKGRSARVPTHPTPRRIFARTRPLAPGPRASSIRPLGWSGKSCASICELVTCDSGTGGVRRAPPPGGVVACRRPAGGGRIARPASIRSCPECAAARRRGVERNEERTAPGAGCATKKGRLAPPPLVESTADRELPSGTDPSPCPTSSAEQERCPGSAAGCWRRWSSGSHPPRGTGSRSC